MGDLVMNRRNFTSTVVGALIGVALGARAQTVRVWRIGYLSAGARPADGGPPPALRQALRALGYVDGQNVTYIARFAEASGGERLRACAAELIAMKVDLVVTLGGWPARVVRDATSTIPVVFVGAADPEGVVIGTLARPGGNVTGFSD